MNATVCAQSTHQGNIDDEIFALDLQLEELKVHASSFKGKHKLGSPLDQELAVSTLQLDIQSHIEFLHDLVFAHSLARAVDTDARTISAIVNEESQIEHDRQLALFLDGQSVDDVPHIETKRNECPVFNSEQAEIPAPSAYGQQQTELTQTLSDGVVDNLEAEAGPSITHSERQKQTREKTSQHKLTCVSCNERPLSHKIAKAPCGDPYCLDCLKEHFMRAIKDKSLYPPRCCRQEIPLDLVLPNMSPGELKDFQRAQIEFGTVNKTYCSSIDCGQFIVPTQIDHNGRASCEFCQSTTCTHCKQASHEGECSEDLDLQSTIAVADELGWKRCYRCNMFVELNMGCNHITCKCGGQFCYECSAPWKTCGCDQWREENLTNRAEEVVDREVMGHLPPLVRAQRVRQVRQELLEQHECDHPGKFERVFHGGRRGFTCEMCEERHWKYILRCRHCHIEVCEDCRRYRVR